MCHGKFKPIGCSKTNNETDLENSKREFFIRNAIENRLFHRLVVSGLQPAAALRRVVRVELSEYGQESDRRSVQFQCVSAACGSGEADGERQENLRFSFERRGELDQFH